MSAPPPLPSARPPTPAPTDPPTRARFALAMSALGSWATDLACVGGIVALAVTHAIEGKLAMMGVLMIAAGRLRPPPPSLNGDLTLGGVGTIALAGGTALVRVVRRWFRV